MNDRPVAAAGSILLAMALLAFIDSTVIFIAEDLGLWQFHLLRACMAIGLVFGLTWFGLVRLKANRLWAVMLRGGCTAIAMLIYFGCLGFLPIGHVAAGLFSAPLWVLIFNWLLFKRASETARILAAFIGFAGVLTVLNPFQDNLDPISMAPLAAGFFYAIGNVATREWCRGETAFAMLLWFFVFLGLFGLLGTLMLSLFPQEVPTGADGFLVRGPVWPSDTAWLLTIMQAVVSIAGVALVMRGYQLAEANFVGIFEYSLLVFAALWGWMLWEQNLTAREITGIAIILFSAGISASTARSKLPACFYHQKTKWPCQ